MIKTHHDDDQPGLFELCQGRMWEFSDNFNDFTKSAASRLFTPADLDLVRPDDFHFLIHNIGMGDQETYGQNKNGDGWPKDACETRVHTFVSDGCFFREHRNRSKDEAIGQIKLAGFHPALRRVETVLWGDKRLAEEEYEMAKAGKALSFSMSARVPWDECTCCGNRAKKASQYCHHLREQMNQWVPEFRKYAFAINRRPTFYDMSRVRTPADRIAHYLEYRFGGDEMRKAAALNGVITGCDWAEYEGVCVPDEAEAVPFPMLQTTMLQKLAAEEAWCSEEGNVKAATAKAAFVREIGPRAFESDFNDEDLAAIRGLRPATFMHEMAKRAAVMPFVTFAAYALGRRVDEVKVSDVVKVAALKYLPRVFRDLEAAGDDTRNRGMWEATSHSLAGADAALDASVTPVLHKAAKDLTLDSEGVRRRIIHNEPAPKLHVDPELVKSASSVDSDAKVLAQTFGYYQLQALCDMENLRGEETTDAQRTLLTSSNNHVYR